MSINYSTSLLSDAAASNVVHTFQTILSTLSTIDAGSSQKVQDLDLLSERDRHQILLWNEARPVYVDKCIHHVIRERTRSNPNSPAVCSWDGELAYAELDGLSSKLARYLLRLGIGPEVAVGVSFEKSMWAIVAQLAILKAGGAFVPVDDSHPVSRLKIIFDVAEVRLLLASPSRTSAFEGLVAKVLPVSSALLETLKDLEVKGDPVTEVNSCNAAFVLYTSGSTGQPKAVVQSHGTICTLFQSHAEALHVDASSRVFQFAAYTFDVSTMDIYTTLMQGGCLCVPSEDDRNNNIAGAINRLHANWADLTPTVASLLHPELVPALRTLVLAGEAAQQEHVHRWVGSVRLINCYGPVESGNCTAYEYPSTSSPADTIGRTMSGAVCWIVNPKDHNQLAAVGEIGELLVEGPTLARGYLKQPEKTAAAFIKAPRWLEASKESAERRFYKTGDLAYYIPDGLISFVGRADLQIKIRGQRVEISEAEYYLSTCPHVANSAVAFPKSGQFAKRLVAIVQLHGVRPQFPVHDHIRLTPRDQLDAIAFCPSEATAFLKANIPVYMVPTAWLAVDHIPLSTSGKVDRKGIEQWLAKLAFNEEWTASRFSSRKLDPIPKDEQIGLEIGHFVTNMISQGDKKLMTVLEANDFLLSALGIDSIQVITLLSWINRKYHIRVTVEHLTRPSTTILSLAKDIQFVGIDRPSMHRKSEHNYVDEAAALLNELPNSNGYRCKRNTYEKPIIKTIYVTGSTGFLGKEILKQLLIYYGIKKIILHVRTDNPVKGFQRIKNLATAAGWWHTSFSSRIEVWPGDLTKPRMGLAEHFWERLTGDAASDDCVDAIIHNGASVRYNVGYETLKATNVLSTLSILEAMSQTSCGGISLVYVSGGQRLSVGVEDDALNIEQVSRSTGYAQTKLVSELLVKKFALNPKSSGHRISIVKPGYIIGTPAEGLANLSDYIWRLVAGAIDAKIYSCDAGWLFIADVERVASEVIDSAFSESRSSCRITKVMDGIDIRELWEILREDFGYELCRLGSDEWWKALRLKVEEVGVKHLLWPLLYMLDREKGEVVSQFAPTVVSASAQARVRAAIMKNIGFLVEEGFLPKGRHPDGFGKAAPGFNGSWSDGNVLTNGNCVNGDMGSRAPDLTKACAGPVEV